MERLGFHNAGYGCATCIGNSSPLPPEISKAIVDNDLLTASVLSGNLFFFIRKKGHPVFSDAPNRTSNLWKISVLPV